MNKEILNQIANKMVSGSKGILAMDESHGTCEKRFNALNISVNEESRRSYRDMLVTADSLSNYISGAILFDETIKQKTSQGESFPDRHLYAIVSYLFLVLHVLFHQILLIFR